MNKRIISLMLLLGLLLPCVKGNTHPAKAVPMDESHWTVNAEEYKFEKYLGVQSLYLPGGGAVLNDVNFHNGTIEFDIAFPQGRGFPGIIFRIQDFTNYEELYIRPHQSGNPDANQYTPIFNGLAGWQLYYGEGHAAPVSYKYDAWNHVKLVISGTVGEVFINDMSKPLFQIYELKHGDVSGQIALKGNANAHFANFSYTQEDNPSLMLPIKELPKPEENIISSYQVSQAMTADVVAGKTELNTSKLSELSWTTAGIEFTGTLNIARIAKMDRAANKNTALVRMMITSNSDQIKKLDFGYSDEVAVFVNHKAVYGGQRTFRSRDYRYLGTIGFFDSLYLDLKKGENEIVFVITEGFGGWGIKARLENMDGIEVNK